MSNPKTLGQIAFEAYGDNRAWKDWRGQPMPQWHEVGQHIRDAWEVAATAVATAVKEPAYITTPTPKRGPTTGCCG